MWFFRRHRDTRIPVYLCAPRQTCQAQGCGQVAECAIQYGADVQVYCAADAVRTIQRDQWLGRGHRFSAEAGDLLAGMATS